MRDELVSWRHLDEKLKLQFASSDDVTRKRINATTREGLMHTSFNYLLLDPKTPKNLAVRRHHLRVSETIAWETFLNATFHVDKGTRSRSLSHLHQVV